MRPLGRSSLHKRPHCSHLVALILLVLGALSWRGSAAMAQCQWAEGLFPIAGVGGSVLSMAVFDDGTGDALYLGIGNVSGILKWDGSNFAALGTGLNGSVSALVVFNDGGGPALYAGGTFTLAGGVPASNIVKWDGSTWSALGSGMNDTVEALAVFNDGGGPALYAGGQFTTAGGVGAMNVAKWNGVSWSSLGSGMNNNVTALAVFDDGGGTALYAGGKFNFAGGVSASRIAKWNGSTWSALGSGTDNIVDALEVFDDGGGPALYAGGSFNIAGGAVGSSHIARWNGATWSALGSGTSNTVSALAVLDHGGGEALYAGGSFTDAGGVSASRIARWDGSIWSALGSGIGPTGNVASLASFDDGDGPELYAGGGFSMAGGAQAENIAQWDGLSWSVVGPQQSSALNGDTRALAVFDDGGGPDVYAGGAFTSAEGVSANYIAGWDGSGWSALGLGMDNQVYALSAFDDGGGPELYAGGEFNTAGGVEVNRIARWDGSAWSALGSGMNNDVFALAVFDDGGGPALYAGGSFTTAGGASANRIARWNGSSWSALGSGVNGSVNALAVFDDGGGPALYAGGSFIFADAITANRIAKWNGSSWSALGSGLGNYASALAVFDDGGGPALYAGGIFLTAGGISASRIAEWNGSSWSSLDSEMTNVVNALAVFDDGSGPALYAGGAFGTAATGLSANRIARWDGSSWSTLGSGMNNVVYALTVFDQDGEVALYAGGSFINAGGHASARIAKWDCTPDCNGNEVPDSVDMANCPPATPACADCNGNDVPDECDIAGSGSEDCDSNGVPDECDIAGCSPEVNPSCGDCNLNGIPDGCDIAAMTSADTDLDGVPDECAQFVGDCPPGSEDLWSCPQNWILDDAGDDYPDNVQFGGPFHVVLDGAGAAADNVILDVPAEINTLLVSENAVLHVLDLGGPGPAIDELTVTDPAGVACNADILVSGHATIDAAGGVFGIGVGGDYGPDPEITDPLGATLTAATLEILEGPPGQAGTMELQGNMAADVLGGATLFGGDDNCTPPILRTAGNAAMAVGGDFIILGGAEIAYASSAPLVLGGDFVNQSTDAEIFDWLGGAICLGACAPSFTGPPTTHAFEAAGRDLGPEPAGFGLNFAMGTVIVGGSAGVTLADGFDNDGQGQALCSETLYVKHLILEAGASITLSGANLYYMTLDDLGATINVTGCGSLQQVAPAPPAPGGTAVCADLDDDEVRDDNCLWWTVDDDGACVATPLVFGDMGGAFGTCAPDGTADGNDRFHSLNCFSDANTSGAPGYPCEASPPQGMNVDAGGPFGNCAADGVCDANDAFHALNAFQGATTCTCAGPIAPLPDWPVPPSRPERAAIELRPSAKRVRPGGLIEIDVILASALDDLRGYQLHLGVSGGQRGALELMDIAIREASVFSIQPSRGATSDNRRASTLSSRSAGRATSDERRATLPERRATSDYPQLAQRWTSDERRATSDERQYWSAFNLNTQQMAAGLDSPGIPAAAGAYLATFTYRASRNAQGTFAIELLADPANPEQRTFLFSTVLSSSPVVASPAAIRLQVDPGARASAAAQ
jgi:hypothetical protein